MSASDYYPFGLGMDNRNHNSPDYAFGFNGKRKDEKGEWGSITNYDYGFRIYNPGIARFLSVDPLTQSYPWYTPYQFAGNRPIGAVDLDGLEELEVQDKVGKDTRPKQANGPTLPPTIVPAQAKKQIVERQVAKKAVGKTVGKFIARWIPYAGTALTVYEIFNLTSNLPAPGPLDTPDPLVSPRDGTRVDPGPVFKPEFDPKAPPNPPSGEGDSPKNIYLHYSNTKGIGGIGASRRIFPNKKGKISLTQTQLSPTEVENLLFLGLPEKKGHGDHVVIFKVDPDQQSNIEKVDELESIYQGGTLKIRENNLIYIGPNPKSDPPSNSSTEPEPGL